MADNITTQSATPATVPASVKIATREVTYSGDASTNIAPVGLVTFAGADDAKTATDVTTTNPLPIGDAGGSLTVDAPVATPVFVRLSDGTSALATLPVSNASLPLPAGASTEATLSALNTKVTAVNTGAVVVSSSALPSGASTAAKQPALGTAGAASADVITVQGIASGTALRVDGSAVTQPVSIAATVAVSVAATLPVSIAATVNVAPNITRGAGVSDANTQRVILASDGPTVTALGGIADAAATTDTGSFSLLAFIKRGLQNWTTLLANIPTINSGRMPVTLSSNIRQAWGAKTTVTVTLASLAATSARESTMVDLSSIGAADLMLRVTTRAGAATTGVLNIYAYASLNDTTYTDGATGADAAFTAASRLNAVFVGAVQLNGATSVTWLGTVAQAFNGMMPSRLGFLFVNASVALDATGGSHVVEYQTLTLAA